MPEQDFSNKLEASRRGSLLLYGGTALLLFVLGLSLWAVFLRIENGTHEASRNNLNVVLNSTHQAARTWLLHKQGRSSKLAESSEIVQFTDELLNVGDAQERLLRAPAQAGLRELLNPVIREEEYLGYFLIGADGAILASDDDLNVGSLSRLAGPNGYLERLKSKSSFVSFPIFTDAMVSNTGNEATNPRPLMFAGANVKGETRNTIASLVFAIDPLSQFAAIMRHGRIGLSGESYAFDRTARLITERRFNDRLYSPELIPLGTSSTLELYILDPGVDLMAGDLAAGPRSGRKSVV